MLHGNNFVMNDYSCAICNQHHLETRDHLLVPLCFVVLAQWIPPALGQFDLQDASSSLKLAISKPFFMELIMLITWSIWITRSDFYL
jgi:hypothetical protein